MKILIAEDEMLISEMLKEIVLDLGHEVIDQVMNYTDAIHVLEKNPEINLVMCDINFNQQKNGIDLGNYIKQNYFCPFIYITSYSDHQTMMDATKTKPTAYIVKPFSSNNIKAALMIAQTNWMDNNQFIVYKNGFTNVKIWAKNIDYIQSQNNYITVFEGSKRHLIRSSMDDFIQNLNCENIIRTHRSYAVNIEKISSLKGDLININKEEIPLSRKHKDNIYSHFEVKSKFKN